MKAHTQMNSMRKAVTETYTEVRPTRRSVPESPYSQYTAPVYHPLTGKTTATRSNGRLSFNSTSVQYPTGLSQRMRSSQGVADALNHES